MKKYLTLSLVLLALSSAFAQTTPPGGDGGARGAANPARRAQMAKFQPIFDLSSTVNLIPDVDKEKGLAFNKDQAKKLLVIFADLAKRPGIKPEEAAKILDNIENKILTTKQLQKMDEIRLKQAEDRRKRREANPNGGGFGGGNGGNGGGGNGNAGGNGGNAGANGGNGGGNGGFRGGGGGFADLLQGKPYNPFKDGRGKQTLDDAVALLKKK
jgi:hypothetical protein